MHNANANFLVTIVSRTSLITAEVIVLVVTWITTYSKRAITQKERHTVTHVVLFNGASSGLRDREGSCSRSTTGTTYFL